MDQEQQLDTLTELIVTDTIAERKTKMIELGDHVAITIPAENIIIKN